MTLEILIIAIGALFSTIMIGVTFFINRANHPKALWMLFFTEMWERFSFYGMRALLMLYMTQVLFFSDKDANQQYGAYNALVYTMPLIGGWIADKLLGFRKSIFLGGILMAIGHLVLAIPSSTTFFLGLGFLISGNGFFKPNISSLLGKFYEENDVRKDAGYSIFYMGINIGAFLGSAACGYLGQKINWHYGFGLAGLLMVLGLIVFALFQKVLENKGHSPVPHAMEKRLYGWKQEHWLYLLGFALVPLALLLVKFYQVTNYIMVPLGIAAVVYIVWMGMRYEREMREKLWACTLLIFFSIVFWGFYEQSGGSLNLMALRNVDMRVGDNLLPSAMVNNSINPFYIILLSPLFAVMWKWLNRNNAEPGTPLKFGIAFLLLGMGYYLFTIGGKVGAATGLMPLIYFAGGYLLITSGELFLSPIGLSMVTKLSPAQMVGYMMGVWFLASAFGHDLGGWIGAQMSIPEAHADGSLFTAAESLPIYMNGCYQISMISLGGGVLIIASSFLVKKWMHGVK
ncbi:MAG: peptide MFS transporter [Bacteroidetes bacterium]|nr:peptide MFS transporter [Bacteroidota bacterium]